MKIRVLHLLSSNRFSGAENIVCQIIHMFDDNSDYEMYYSSPDGPIRESLRDQGIINYLPIKMSLFGIRNAITSIKPDIIHAHDMKASVIAALVCGSTPLISQIHNNSIESRKLSIKTVLYRYAAKKARHIIWVSQSAYEGYFYHKIIKDKSTVLYNVIDDANLRRLVVVAEECEKIDIVFLGRLSYEKNPEMMVEVVSKVIKDNPQVKCSIIGTGEYYYRIKNTIDSYKISNNVKIMGFMKNPYRVLQSASVLIITSRWEGMPLCALEAMALGVPIVSTPTDGLREIVIQGKTGFLCETVEEMVKKISLIIYDEHLQCYMRDESIKRSMQLNNKKKYKTTLRNIYQNSII